MELSMSGGALRTFTRCATCLARVGSDLVLQAHPAKLELHTLNSSRSAYASISLAREFFDDFRLSAPAAAASAPSSPPLQCSVLLKSVLSVLRTPTAALDRIAASLPHPDAPKLQLTLHCLNGVKKTYWISCSAEAEVQTLSLDRGSFSSHLTIRPRDLARLLSNFQSSLQELTVIATDPAAGLSNVGVDGEVEGKAVELRSYIDPTKDDCDTRLHTQLWIDPIEEFVEYVHSGDPVDVTFGVKELKAFLTFCEGCEVDILLFFQKAGEPVLLVPKFGLDDGSSSDFDATLVLATMLVSQLTDSNVAQQPANSAQHAEPRVSATPPPVPENVSNHTKIWSELSGSAPKSFEVNREKHTQKGRNANANALNDTSMLHSVNAPFKTPVADNANDPYPKSLQLNIANLSPDVVSDNPRSQHHPSNWVGADEEDDDEEEDEELFVQTTPHYMD
uniref:Cell cycle checkpoint control protein RAD9A n=1 Tax=Leersia perrieri TaxID=77586 RepID=A0A0D9VTX4_9ORYZ